MVEQSQDGAVHAIGAEAEWVKALENSAASVARESTGDPIRIRLVDMQIHHSDTLFARYRRLIQEINDPTQIEDASHFIYELRPGQQRIVFHHCWILRGDQRIDALASGDIRCFQRETGLERQVYTQNLTVQLSLHDLRPGDTIDFATTLENCDSAHPVFDHWCREQIWLSSGKAVDRLHVSIDNASSSPLSLQHLYSANELDERSVLQPGERHERDISPMPVRRYPHAMPERYWPETLVVCTRSDWPTISDHLARAYTEAGLDAEALNYEGIDTSTWQRGEEQTAAQIIRFVQDQVRYRGEFDGIHSHVPHVPNGTLARRSGDCKDKSVLLRTMLNDWGFDAELALVNTDLREAVDMLEPSPFLFDHMIVRLTHAGVDYFVDATAKKQGGQLRHSAPCPYGVALPVREGGAELQHIARPQDETVFEQDIEFDFKRVHEGEAEVSIKRIYRGNRANNMRYHFDSTSREQLEERYLQYAEDDSTLRLEPIDPIRVSNDDRALNVLCTQERYRVRDVARLAEDNRVTVDCDIHTDLSIPNDIGYPCRLYLDGILEHRVTVHYPSPPKVEPQTFERDNAWFRYEDRIERDENTLRFIMRAEPRTESVQPDDQERYREDVDALRQRSGSSFPAWVNPPASGWQQWADLALPLVTMGSLTGMLLQRDSMSAQSLLFWLSLPVVTLLAMNALREGERN